VSFWAHIKHATGRGEFIRKKVKPVMK